MSPIAGASQDLSIFGLVRNADIVVQAIMFGLMLASVGCWSIIVEKSVRVARLGRQIGRLERVARDADGGAGALDGARDGLVGALSDAAREEFGHAEPSDDRDTVRSRLEQALRTATRRHLKSLEPGLPFLATTGSAAPFVGLLGTVWGIMHSFTSIAQSKDTSLAVVAPGIAEALFATAVGLAVAIPAVVAYNHFAVRLGRAGERIAAVLPGLARSLVRRSEATR